MLGENIRKLRKQKRMTMKELGQVLGLGESTIGMYENNKRTPDTETLQKIADFFHVSTDYLYGRGVFAQKELIVELREVITEGLRKLIEDEMVEYSKKLSDDQFILALSMIVEKIKYNQDTGEVTIYYYLESEETTTNKPMLLDSDINKSNHKNIPKISGIDENGEYVEQFSGDESLEIIKDLANLPDEAMGDLKVLFGYLDLKHNKGK